VKIGSIVCLVIGLVFFGIATVRSRNQDMGPVMTDEQLEEQGRAQAVIHESTNPGSKVDPAAVEAARAVKEEAQKEYERQMQSRKLVTRILQGLGGVSILAGIILYVLEKRSE
jgi:hypothetical protein